MTRKQLADATAKRSGFTQKDTRPVVYAMWDVLAEQLIKGDKVVIEDFGTFSVLERAPRECPDPNHPGEMYTIPARRVAHFCPYPAFKDLMNNEEGKHRDRRNKYLKKEK